MPTFTASHARLAQLLPDLKDATTAVRRWGRILRYRAERASEDEIRVALEAYRPDLWSPRGLAHAISLLEGAQAAMVHAPARVTSHPPAAPDEYPHQVLLFVEPARIDVELLELSTKLSYYLGREHVQLGVSIYIPGSGWVSSLELVEETTPVAAAWVLVHGEQAALVRSASRVLTWDLTLAGMTVTTDRDREWRDPVHTCRLRSSELERWLGFEGDDDLWRSALERMGYGVRGQREELEVIPPAYRFDVVHPVDVVQDLMSWFQPTETRSAPVAASRPAGRDPLSCLVRDLRSAFLSLGYEEQLTSYFCDPRLRWMFHPEKRPVKVLHAAREDRPILRPSLVPGLLEVLARSQHLRYPQYLCEVDGVCAFDGALPELRLGAAVVFADSDATVSTARSALARLRVLLGRDLAEVAVDLPGYIEGRSLEVTHRGNLMGHAGEIHPAVLQSLGLEVPVAALDFLDFAP